MSVEAERYEGLRRTLEQMGKMEYGGNYDYGCHPQAAQHAIAQTVTLERDGVLSPLLITDNDGSVSLTWRLADWKLYRTFDENGEREDMILPGKNADLIDRRGAFGSGNLPALPLPKLKYTVTEETEAAP